MERSQPQVRPLHLQGYFACQRKKHNWWRRVQYVYFGLKYLHAVVYCAQFYFRQILRVSQLSGLAIGQESRREGTEELGRRW